MKKLLFSMFLFSALLNNAYSYYGSSNIIGLYPDHSCRKPHKPFGNDRFEWEMFKDDADRYRRCIKEYVEATENDSNTAAQKGNEAVREYNNFLREIQY